MSPKFNNHYDRKMYNRKRHRRRSAEARALEEPQFRQQVIEPKEEKWSYDEYLRTSISDEEGDQIIPAEALPDDQ